MFSFFLVLQNANLQAQAADDAEMWNRMTDQMEGLVILSDPPVGGRNDLMGNGALLLAKKDTGVFFWKTSEFYTSGVWKSGWNINGSASMELSWKVYGRKQDMSTGWKKFEGNPLISANGWTHNTPATLELPADYSDTPADQSLVKGSGEYEGKWLLLFNIGGWAVKGWGMAIADSLAPLKQGKNPFCLAEPYPLTKATGGYNAPNDWIFVDELWYAPDESRDNISRMWTSEDLKHWVLRGPIAGINGHDPGMAWDGEFYYLFNEAGDKITLVYAVNPLGAWEIWPDTKDGVVLEVGNHTGDADVAFFNNRWHIFVDEGPHRKYKLSYASASPEDFPLGWELQKLIFGPYNPDQNQVWDNDNPEGNNFGTGDADVALEGSTLYMTYETPVGIAFKELDVLNAKQQTLMAKIEYKKGKRIESSRWINIPAGVSKLDLKEFGTDLNGKTWRLILKLETENSLESPMVEWIRFE